MGRKTIEYRDPASLTPYENNPRDNGASVPRVAESIREFGFQAPIIVDADGVIIAGHTRLKAALELGLREVPVVVADDLTPEQVRAYRLADNKAGEASEWLDAMLAEELSQIGDIDMSLFGFEMPEMDLGEAFGLGMGDGSEDEVPEVEEVEPIVKRGQIWRLGNHVLMCGDSTSEEDVGELMQGTRAEMCFTSPPYNAGKRNPITLQGDGTHITEAEARKYMDSDDAMSEAEYADFLDRSLAVTLAHCQEAFYNIGVIADSKRGIIELVHRHLAEFKDIMYWRKSVAVPQIVNSIASAIEPIWIFGRNGTRAFRKDIGHYLGVIEGPNAPANEFATVHKATFPLYLPTQMAETFTNPGESVYDPFGGTGTTMIACEQTGRRCRMMELEPRYCDVIIARWEKATGKKAELMEGS